MHAKKGISATMETFLILVVLLVTAVIFASFISGGSLQIKGLIHQQIGATGEIPCTKSSTIIIREDVGGAVYINTSKSAADALKSKGFAVVPLQLRANISSSCLENLSITWDFGDGSPAIDTECSYVTGLGYATWNETGKAWTNETCTTVNHTYALNSVNDIWTTKNIVVSAFGSRSGYYSEASTTGFILDPYFSINIQIPITDKYNCVSLAGTVYSTKGNVPLDQITPDVIDNKKLVPVDQIKSSALSYRAPSGINHTVQVLATKGYQTAKSNINAYTAPISNPTQEIAVFGKPNGLTIYSAYFANLDSNFFPKTDYEQKDFDARDLDGNGAAEFAFLMANPKDLYVQSYSGIKDSPQTGKLTSDQLRLIWPYQNLTDSVDWKAVATGNKITASNGHDSGNIVVLGNPGDLDLYKYSAGGLLTLVEHGSTFADSKDFACKCYDDNGNEYACECNDWQDVATADFNKDGEYEIVALRGSSDLGTGDLYVFKYGDYKKVNNTKPYWVDIDNKDWKAVAATTSDRMSPYNIVAVGEPGDLVLISYAGKDFFIQSRPDWPDDVGWRDVAITDYNKDGVDELAFLYKNNNGDFKVLVTSLAGIMSNPNFSNKIATLESWVVNNKYGYVQSLGSSSDWQAITAGDIACFL
jgi:hypothetical protein